MAIKTPDRGLCGRPGGTATLLFAPKTASGYRKSARRLVAWTSLSSASMLRVPVTAPFLFPQCSACKVNNPPNPLSPGVLLGTETPVMTHSGRDFSGSTNRSWDCQLNDSGSVQSKASWFVQPKGSGCFHHGQTGLGQRHCCRWCKGPSGIWPIRSLSICISWTSSSTCQGRRAPSTASQTGAPEASTSSCPAW